MTNKKSWITVVALAVLSGTVSSGWTEGREILPKYQNRKKIEGAFTPETLFEYGIFNPEICNTGKMDFKNGWTNTYSTMSCYGHQEFIIDIGDVTIAHQPEKGTGAYTMTQVYKNYVSDMFFVPDDEREPEMLNINTATLTADNSAIPVLKEWNSTASLTSTARPSLNQSFTEKVTVTGTILNVKTVNGKYKRQLDSAPTCDWLIFAAVQQLPKDPALTHSFDMLEACRAHRPGQELTFKGQKTYTFGSKKVKLSCFEQIGEGILPYQYFLDENNRLVLVISGYRILVLNP